MEFFTASDGARLAFGSVGSGPPLLLVHGALAIHRTWDRVVPLLATHFSCISLDRRGRGESEEGVAYSVEREITDLVEIMQAAGPTVRLLGHSSGALLLLEAAQRQATAAMVLYEPPMVTAAVSYPETAVAAMQRLVAGGRREDALLYFLRDVQGRPEAAIDALRQRPSWAAQVAEAHLLAAEFAFVAAYRQGVVRLNRLQTRSPGHGKTDVHFFYGSETRPMMRESTRALAAAVPGSSLAELPRGTHDAIREMPEAFAAMALDFLLQ